MSSLIDPHPADVARFEHQLGPSRFPYGHPGVDVGDLSPRQVEVLRLIASGLSNGEIARQLFIGLNTVKTYIRTAYQCIGVTTRSQAVIWGFTHGLTPEIVRQAVQTAGHAVQAQGEEQQA